MERPSRRRKRVVVTNCNDASSSNPTASAGRQTQRQATYRASLSHGQEQRAYVVANGQQVPIAQPNIIGDTLPPFSTSRNLASPLYKDLGDCDVVCEFCGAWFWFDERLLSSPLKYRPKYTICCRGGRVVLPFPSQPPENIRVLFSDPLFMANIRAYNSMFAMTSFGALIEHSVNNGAGPYVFKITGQVSHWLGSLCPPEGQCPRFLQMYIFDSENEVSNRLRFFSATDDGKLSPEVVALLISTLEEGNEYVRLFKGAREICNQPTIPEFVIRLRARGPHRNYEAPSAGCLGAIVCDNDSAAEQFDVVIRSKDNTPHRVSKLHPSYMPLQYPLLFPRAEQGWSPDLHLTPDPSSRDRKLTMNMFYSFQLHERQDTYTHILRAGRLFQQYLVDAYVCVEQCRLEYFRLNQTMFRTEFLSGLHDALSRGDTEASTVGKRIVLPPSFTGGPRYMYKHYQDALAICRVHGNPQYFITLTCNVKWPEIKRAIAKFQNANAHDRPDIIARVFQLKVEAFVKHLRNKKPFGQVAADLYTIEFQKRGLPDCHLLLWVTDAHKIRKPADVDMYITAELPDQFADPVLHRIVTDCMLHGPCGLANMKAPCMVDVVCSKSFPKSNEQETHFDKEGYVHYRRAADDRSFLKSGVPLDNRYVVPYNKNLCMHFDAHINVEYCGWSMLIKYLFKYISKGVDRARFSVTKASDMPSDSDANTVVVVDEVTNYTDGRFVCPHEATWRLLNFPIHHRNPAVQVLAVHLEGMQDVTFRDFQNIQSIVNNPGVGKTTLTEWLRNNLLESLNPANSAPSGLGLRYIDYLTKYRWEPSGKSWILRTSTRTPSIGRLRYVHPTCGELFYLRLLLNHQTGCRSFAEIRTVEGTVYLKFRAACEKLGLIGDDREWVSTFTEAAQWATSGELRSLFTHMLLFCDGSNPLAFWEDHWHAMSDDIVYKLQQTGSSACAHVNDEDLRQYVLYELELLLNSCSTPSSLSNFGLPIPSSSVFSALSNRLLLEEKNYDREKLTAEHSVMYSKLRPTQLTIYNTVLRSIAASKQVLLFVYGHGGTGKTFLWKCILNALRSQGKVVLAVTGSGIASLLLPGGRTAHSRFKIPIDLTEESVCYVKKNTQLSKLLLQTSLIIWDEAPMSDRRCFESVDRTLRDITGHAGMPFGGIPVLLGGDFRQTLPINPKAPKSDIIAACLSRSYLWKHFVLHKLTENMRLLQEDPTSSTPPAVGWFSKWLLDVGDGKLGLPVRENQPDLKLIEIPEQFIIQPTKTGLIDLIRFVYNETILSSPTAVNMADRAIISPKNKTVDEINDIVNDLAPGEAVTYLSTDTMTPHSCTDGVTDVMYPTEYLNLLTFNGIPPHCLRLKKTPLSCFYVI